MTLSCYGKLPAYKDYLRWNAEGPEAEFLCAWLHAGEARARASERTTAKGSASSAQDGALGVLPSAEAAESLASRTADHAAASQADGAPAHAHALRTDGEATVPTISGSSAGATADVAVRPTAGAVPAAYRMLLSPPGAKKVIVGTLRASTDEGGLRRFPFSIWTTIEARLAPRDWHLLPLHAAGIWPQIEEIDRELSTASTAEDVYARLRGRGLTMPADLGGRDGPSKAFQQRARALRGRDFWNLVLGSAGEPKRYLLVRNLMSAVTPFLRSKRPLGIALRFPSPSEVSEAAFAAGIWISTLALQLPKADLRPSLFLTNNALARARHDRSHTEPAEPDGRNGDSSAESLFILFRLPEEMDYEALMDRGGVSDYIEDLLAGDHSVADDGLSDSGLRLVNGEDSLSELMKVRWP